MSPGNCGVFQLMGRGEFSKNTDILQFVGMVRAISLKEKSYICFEGCVS